MASGGPVTCFPAGKVRAGLTPSNALDFAASRPKFGIEPTASDRATTYTTYRPYTTTTIDKMGGQVDVTASQWRLVEVGRIVLHVSGPFKGRTSAVVEIIDHKRVRVHPRKSLGGMLGAVGSRRKEGKTDF